jgi:preprotein translocase subunit SecG
VVIIVLVGLVLLQRPKSKAIDHEGTKFWKERLNQKILNLRTSWCLAFLRVLRVALRGDYLCGVGLLLLQRPKSKSTAIDHEGTKVWKKGLKAEKTEFMIFFVFGVLRVLRVA